MSKLLKKQLIAAVLAFSFGMLIAWLHGIDFGRNTGTADALVYSVALAFAASLAMLYYS